jgi:hypothetical protein
MSAPASVRRRARPKAKSAKEYDTTKVTPHRKDLPLTKGSSCLIGSSGREASSLGAARLLLGRFLGATRM